MDIRTYTEGDRDACLAMFDQHAGTSFSPIERPDYERFLDHERGEYYVCEHEGRVVGAGGYAGDRLRWLMVSRELQKQGVGRFLALWLMRRQAASVVQIDTTPNVVGFYERLGFRIMDRSPDGFAPGYDRVRMMKKMSVCD